MTEETGGVRHDAGKPRWDLFDLPFLQEVDDGICD